MEPHEYLLSLRKHWIVILLLIVLGAGGAYGLIKITPVSYQAKSVVFVSASQGSSTAELVQGSTFTQGLVQSYAQLVSTPRVLEPVIEDLNLDVTASALAGSVSADTPLNTVLIDITVTNRDPASAARIANSVADSLSTQVKALSPSTSDNTPAITMSVVTPASAPTVPSAPNARLIYISGIVLGLLLGIAYAVLRELLDTRIRGDRDIARVTGLPILGTISRDQLPGIALLRDRQGRVAEDFRRVRINLEFVAVESQLRTVVVTSASPAEGKSTVSINLALALAERDKRVLLIDADLRRPSVHRYAQIDGTVGLTSVLLGRVSLADAVQPWGSGAIDVLPSGLIPPNPEQLLSSEPMIRILDLAAKSYDVIVIDSPPVLPVADTLSLSRVVDGIVVVARFGATRRPALARTLESLESIHGPVAGVVLNSVRTRRSHSNNYYGYGSEEELALAGAAALEEELVDAEPVAIDAASTVDAAAPRLRDAEDGADADALAQPSGQPQLETDAEDTVDGARAAAYASERGAASVRSASERRRKVRTRRGESRGIEIFDDTDSDADDDVEDDSTQPISTVGGSAADAIRRA